MNADYADSLKGGAVRYRRAAAVLETGTRRFHARCDGTGNENALGRVETGYVEQLRLAAQALEYAAQEGVPEESVHILQEMMTRASGLTGIVTQHPGASRVLYAINSLEGPHIELSADEGLLGARLANGPSHIGDMVKLLPREMRRPATPDVQIAA